MLYPFKFQPLYKDYIWGGRNLAKIGKTLPPYGIIAESWEISCHPNGVSIISNGEFAGELLTKIIEKYAREIIGQALSEQDLVKLPIMLKLIDANDRLSVQVHPNMDYARIHEQDELGKHEMWYIISAEPGSKLIVNLRPGTTKDTFLNAVKNNNIESCLQTIEVSAGDVINIPTGLVHAIGRGIVLAEVQQTSDLTYRVYDYGRVDKNGVSRPLQIEKALDVIDFHSVNRQPKMEGIEIRIDDSLKLKYLMANQYFAVELVQMEGQINQFADGRKFYLYFCLAGRGEITYDKGALPFQKGESVLIPASLGEYKFKGKFNVLKAYVPDLRQDIFQPLKSFGFTDLEIYQKVMGLNLGKR